MFKVEIIELNCFNGLKDSINSFFAKNFNKINTIVDIKYGTYTGENGLVYYASIVYEE